MSEMTFTNPECVWFWQKTLHSHFFMIKHVFFRHHWCNDSGLAYWLCSDQSMTKACVTTFGDICIFICDIKNSSPLPQVSPGNLWNRLNTVPHVPAK